MSHPFFNRAPVAPQSPPIPRRLNSVVYKGVTPALYFGLELADRLFGSRRYLGARRDGLTDRDGRPPARLCEHLAATARQVFTNEGVHSRVSRAVIVAVSMDKYAADVENGGAAAHRLKTGLERRHAEEFKGQILDEARGVVYLIVPHAGPQDEIHCHWGSPVFGVTERSQPRGRLTAVFIQSDGTEIPIEEPSYPLLRQIDGHDDLIPDSRPAAVYDGQRFLLFGGALGSAAIVLSRWFGDNSDGWAFIDLEARGEAARGRGDGVVVAPKGMIEHDPTTGARTWTFSAVNGGDRPGDLPEKLRITYTPDAGAASVSAPPPRPAAASPASSVEPPPEERQEEGGTVVILPRRDPPPAAAAGDGEAAAFSLDIVGLPLQRIDGRCALPGLEDWRLVFDADGRLAENRGVNHLALGARSAAADLIFAAPGGEWRPVRMNGDGAVDLPLADGGRLTLYGPPSPLADRIHAILRLRNPLSIPLRADRDLTFGRGSPSPDRVTPGLLEIPGSLRLADDDAATLEQVGLSRRHLRLRVDGARGCLRVAMLDGRAPAWIFDADGALRETLRPGCPDAAELAPGAGLLVGNYLMSFNARKN